MKCSLADLIGWDAAGTLAQNAVFFGHADEAQAHALAFEEIELIPNDFLARQEALLKKVGETVSAPMRHQVKGASTAAFEKVTNRQAAPVGGFGLFRIGEDGRLYMSAKSEHYHTPLGHGFPGYRLVDNARRLGVTNATHNNARGFIVRLLEEKLVSLAGYPGSEPGMPKIDRVLNLETGSLACEAAIKHMLGRFYRSSEASPLPLYSDRIPVFFVMQDNEGGGKAGYHGTTIHAHLLRDMWPEMSAKMANAGIWKVVPVIPNDIDDFAEKIARYNRPPYKAAGFLHEIILMNYGAVRLTEEYLHRAHALCRQTDTPVLVDEIQSCAWYPKDGMLFKRYGLHPDFVTVGKGLPGGEYASSRLLFDGRYDTLQQFDSLVTNGQQELSALCYLITFKALEALTPQIERVTAILADGLKALAHKHPDKIEKLSGDAHMSALVFHTADAALSFSAALNRMCIDSSTQVHKAGCPPTVLTKIPVISTEKVALWLLEKMDTALADGGY